jgi:hypothetical protein
MSKASGLLLIGHQTAVIKFNCSWKETGAAIHKWVAMWDG